MHTWFLKSVSLWEQSGAHTRRPVTCTRQVTRRIVWAADCSLNGTPFRQVSENKYQQPRLIRLTPVMIILRSA